MPNSEPDREIIRILHVDDDKSMSDIFRAMLTELNGSSVIDSASDVDEALEKLADNNYDVIVSDYEMPIKNGLDFLKELKQRGNGLPFILFTGKGREEVAIQALNLGVDGYYNKQGNPETVYGELIYGVRKVIERRKTKLALDESEKRCQTIMQQAREMIFIHDSKGRFIYANPQACKNLGFSSEELYKMTVVDVDTYATEAGLTALWPKVLAGEKFTFETVHRRKDGSLYPAEVSISAIIIQEQQLVMGFARDISERRKAQQALNESLVNYQSLINGMIETAWVIDFEGGFLEVNDAAVQVLGYTKDELLKIGIAGIDRHLSKEQVQKLIDNLSQVKKQVFETVHTTKDGIEIPVEISSSLITYNGRTAILSISRNIAKRKETENKLRTNEARLRFIASNLPGIVWTADRDLRFTSYFGLGLKELGLKEKQVVGMKLKDFLKDEPDNERVFTHYLRALAGEKIEFISQFNQRSYLNFLEPIRDMRDQITGFLAFSLDITEQKNSQDKLKQSTSQLSGIIESSSDQIFLLDRDCRYLSVNKTLASFLGKSPEEFVGKTVSEMYGSEDSVHFLKNINTVLETGKNLSVEEKMNALDRELIISSSLNPIKDDNGQVIAVAGIVRDITKRTKMEEEFRASEERYRTLFEQTGDYILVLEILPSGVPIIYDANDYALNAHGYNREELIGKPITFLDTNSGEAVILERVKRLLKDEKLSFEAEHRRKDGSLFKVEVINKHVKIRGKDFLLAIERDITEQKKYEEELEIASNLFNLATDGIFVTNLDGTLVYFNEAAYNQRGYSREEMSKMTIDSLEANESPQNVQLRIKKLREKGSLVFESAHLCKDGSRIPVEVHARIIDSSGKKLILAVVRDITERKKVEEKLVQSDRIFENTIDMICMAGFDGYFKVLNPAWSTTLGWSNDELLSKPWIEFVHPEDRESTNNAKATLVNGKEVFQFENRYLHKNGGFRWLSWNSYPYPKEKLIFAVARDITERKEASDRLAVVNEKLQVTGSLTRHDVKNKLSIIRANTYLLRKIIGDKPELAKYLEEIDSAAEASNKMFEFSSTYEKIGSEPLSLIDVSEYFKQASALLPRLQTINIINECKGLTVIADSLLRQLFYNLLDNSLKHGQKVTSIHLHFKKDGGGLKLFYEDDGVGIPTVYRSKLFTDGFTTGRGSGLGLKLIRKLVEAYGWSITEEGREGKGVQFVITIPELTKSPKV